MGWIRSPCRSNRSLHPKLKELQGPPPVEAMVLMVAEEAALMSGVVVEEVAPMSGVVA